MTERFDRLLESGDLATLSGRTDSLDLIRHLSRPFLANSLPARRSENRLAGTLPTPDSKGCVFILVDGLGMASRDLWPEGGFFSRTFSTEILSVFPSTTACALSALATCRTTGNLGITGWDTYVPQIDTVVTFLPFVNRESGNPVTDRALEELLPQRTVRDRYAVPFRTILPASFMDGEYNRWASGTSAILGYEDIEHALALTADPQAHPSFTYLYLPQVDHAEHHHGPLSEETARAVAEMDDLLLRIRQALPQDVPIFATADHGQVPVALDEQIPLGPEHPLMEFLSAPPAGEAVQPVFHVKSGLHDAFRESFARLVDGRMHLITPSILFDRGFLGDEGIHPDTRRRFGDFVGIAGDRIALPYTAAGMKPAGLIGYHGGLRPDEVRVPIFVA